MSTKAIGALALRRTLEFTYAGLLVFVYVSSVSGQSEFSRELQRTKDLKSLQSLLDTPDPQNARLVILRIGDVFKTSSVPYLRGLWSGNAPDPSFENGHILYDPVVRLMLAHQLETYQPDKSYREYIIEHLDDRRHAVQASAVDALESINDPEAVSLAQRKAYSDNFLIAWAAVDVLMRQSRKESLSEPATSALQSILDDHQYPHTRLKQEIRGGQGSTVFSTPEKVSKQEPKENVESAWNADLFRQYLIREEFDKAIELILPLARGGNLDAANTVGELYLFVKPPNFDAAIEWFQYGMNRGDPAAMVSMANMYLTGRGVEKSREKAVELARLARDKGYREGEQLFDMLTKTSQ